VKIVLRIFDVEHGASAMLAGSNDALAMIDCGHNSTTGWLLSPTPLTARSAAVALWGLGRRTVGER